ncbi:MAG: hypothetical protein JST11_26110 [Acidobacteria bacterium]|nr:hypothetical protein [Acidobacteriota bacterium]
MTGDGACFKAHGEWFRRRACGRVNDRMPDALERYWHHRSAESPCAASAHPWTCMGPFDVAGRTTALAVHPHDPELLFAGSANGGVWLSRNGGGDWEWKWIRWGATSIGALAFDPVHPRTLYAATGEANGSVDAYPGSGIYVTHDLGETWKHLARAGPGALPRRIAALTPHPCEKHVLWLGGVSYEAEEPAGLYYSHDAGATWTREDFFSRRRYRCYSIAFQPDGAAFVALDLGGAQTGIWRRTARGWKQLSGGLPPGDRTGRISLALAPADPRVVYALVAGRFGDSLLGVYRSADAGETWRNIAGGEFSGGGAFAYYNTIAVRPDDPDSVVVGVMDVHITRDAGATWKRATHWDFSPAGGRYAHGDHHAILLPGGDLIYTANDGGVARSVNFGDTWEMRVHNMCTTMFYHADVSPHDSNIFGGGAQDNGCLATGDATNPGGFVPILGGDGISLIFDPHRAGHAWAVRSDVHLSRHTAPLHWTREFWRDISPRAMEPAEHKQNPFSPVAVDPRHSDTLWTASQRLWRTDNGGHHWEPKSPVLDRSQVTAIHVAGDTVFAGTAAGGIFRGLDRGEHWSGDLSGPEIPAVTVAGIDTHPLDPDRVVIAAGGLFCSTDGAITWREIDCGGMPEVSCHAVLYERKPPHRLFIATDCGVWMTHNLVEFTDLTGDLPNVLVSHLVYHEATHTLWAATYGRGIWRLRLG